MAQLRKELREAREERNILNERWLSLPGRSDEPASVRRGGEGAASQRR